MKLTDSTYACNSLTNFEYEAYQLTGNGNAESFPFLKIREINGSESIYLADFSQDYLCVVFSDTEMH